MMKIIFVLRPPGVRYKADEGGVVLGRIFLVCDVLEDFVEEGD